MSDVSNLSDLPGLLPYETVRDEVVDLTAYAAKDHPEGPGLRLFRDPVQRQRMAHRCVTGEVKALQLVPHPWAIEKLVGIRVRIFTADPGAHLFVSGPFVVEPGLVRISLLSDEARPAEDFGHPTILRRLRAEAILMGGRDPIEVELRAEGGDVLAVVEAVILPLRDDAFGERPTEAYGVPSADQKRVLLPFFLLPDGDEEIVLRPGTDVHLSTRSCGWGDLRVLGLVLPRPDCAPGAVLGAEDLRIVGGPNLLHDEAPLPLSSLGLESGDSPMLFRLRHEPLVKTPNVAQISLHLEAHAGTSDARLRLFLYAAIVHEHPVRNGRKVPGILRVDLPRGTSMATLSHGKQPPQSRGKAVLTFGSGRPRDAPALDAVFPEAWEMNRFKLALHLRRLADALEGDGEG